MELLLFNADTGLTDVNWKELNEYPEFKVLHSLNYNKEAGDVDGRKRFRATREVKYIKAFYDPMSSQNRKGLNNEAKRLEIIALYNLGADFEESKELQDAISVYIKNHEFVSYKMLKVTRKTILSYINSLDKMQEDLQAFKNEDAEEEKLKSVIESGKYLLQLVKELPAALTSLQDIEEKIANNQLGAATAVFGDAIPSRFEDTRTKR